jgi:hypothetical protein
MNHTKESITPVRLEFNNENDGVSSHGNDSVWEKIVTRIHEEQRDISFELVRNAGEVMKRNKNADSFSKAAVSSETPRLKKKRSSKDISSSGSGYPPLQSPYGFRTYYGRCTRTDDGVFIPVENSMFANPDSNWTTWSRCDTRYLGNHFPVSYSPEYMNIHQMKRRCCKVPSCSRKPSVYCMTCGVPLCITMDSNGTNCFVQFHTKTVLEK